MCSSFTYLGIRHPRKKEEKKNLVSTCVTEHIVMSHVRWTLSYDDSFVWAIRLFYMPVRDMAHGNVKRMMDSFMSSTWRTHMCNVTHLHMQHKQLEHDPFMYATWLDYMILWYASVSESNVTRMMQCTWVIRLAGVSASHIWCRVSESFCDL